MNRLTWYDYYMEIAKAVSMRSSCPRAMCGAVVVSPYNRILGTGYNGAAAGQVECLYSECLMEDGHCQRAIHAEVNAVLYSNDVRGATVLYI